VGVRLRDTFMVTGSTGPIKEKKAPKGARKGFRGTTGQKTFDGKNFPDSTRKGVKKRGKHGEKRNFKIIDR